MADAWDVVGEQSARKPATTAGAWDVVGEEEHQQPAPAPQRSAQDYVFDLATRVRQGTRNVVGGLAGLPVDIANLVTEPTRLAARGGDAVRGMLGMAPLDVPLGHGIPALQQPDVVQGIRESGNINNAIDAAEHLSPMAEQQAQEFQSQDGLLASLGYLAQHPGYAGTEAAAQLPQFLQIAPGSTLGTIALQGASAASQNNQQIGDTMRSEGASEQQIADTLADAYTPSLLGNTLLPALVPGGSAIERMLAGRAGKEALAEGGGGLRRALVDFLGETGTEGAQEALDQVVQNAATGHPLTEQVGQNAALGALIGAPGGAVAGAHEALVTPQRQAAPLEAEPAPQTNAIDPVLLARGNAQLADAAPADIVQAISDATAKPAEAPAQGIESIFTPEVLAALGLPTSQPARTETPPAPLPIAEPSGQDPREVAARMRQSAQERAAQQTTANTVQPLAPVAGSDRAGGDLATTRGADVARNRGDLNVRMNGHEFPVDSVEDASAKFLQLRDAQGGELGGMPAVELTNKSGRAIGYIGHNGEVYGEPLRTGKQGEPIYDPRTPNRYGSEPIDGEAARAKPAEALPPAGPVEHGARTQEQAMAPPERFSPSDLRGEIGWSQQGGRLVRAAPDDRTLNDEERAGIVAQPKGDVIGRTTWVGHPAPDGTESVFWRNRPDKSLSIAKAHEALDKFERGEKLRPIEQRFVDHAQSVARDYDRMVQDQLDEQQSWTEGERQSAFDAIRNDHANDVADADQHEALSLYDLAHRASRAGVDDFDLVQATNEPDKAYAARLWGLIAENEANGADTRATEENRAGRDQGREGGQEPAAEPFALEQPAAEEAKPAARVSQQGLFAPPSGRELAADAQRRADNERNGLGRDLVRPEQGAGDLLAGARPEQGRVDEAPGRARHPNEGTIIREKATGKVVMETTDPKKIAALNTDKYEAVPAGQHLAELNQPNTLAYKAARGEPASANELSPDDLTESEREVRDRAHNANIAREKAAELSRAQGERDAQDRGFTEAIGKVLGDQADRVEFVRDENGLPESLREGVQNRNAERATKGAAVRTAAVYDPTSQRVFILTSVVKSADRAAWNAMHEIAGHDGLRKLLGPKLDRALEIALQNPTVKAVGDAIAAERKIDTKTQRGRLLAAEEALAELAAAVGTGDFDSIGTRYGVDVPEGVRATLQRAVENFLRRLKDMLDDLFGRHVFTDEDVRALLDAAREASKGEGDTIGGMAESTERARAPQPSERDIERMRSMGEDAYIREITDGRPPQKHAEAFTFAPKPLPAGTEPLARGVATLPDGRAVDLHEVPDTEDSGTTRIYAAIGDEAIGFIGGDELESELLVAPEYRRSGVGLALQRAYRARDPFAPTGGMTAAGERMARKLFREFTAQPAQTDTPAFRKWFGDSKVVDDQGKPLVVYHGTGRRFSRISMKKGVQGLFWMTSDKSAVEAGEVGAAARGVIMDLYAKIENPAGWDQYDKKSIGELKRDGYDGLMLPDGDGQFTVVAFDPRQIKSADRNRGTFDPNKPSILENVEPAPIRADHTGESIVREGRLLSLIDAAKAKGADLSALTEAVKNRDTAALHKAIDDLLPALKPPMRETGVKNAVTDRERAEAGRNPILADAIKSNESTVTEAIDALKADPAIGAETIAKLSRAGVEGISLADEAVLLVHKTDLLNKREAAAKKLADPNASEDAKEAARQAWSAAEAEIAAVDIAAKNSGREWGRFGQFRQRMLREDFTLAALERKERVRLERPLTAEESATVKAMADTIATLQKRVDDLQARVANSESEWAYEHMTRRVAKPRDRLDSLRRAADDARRRLRANQGVPSRRGQSGAIISPTMFYDLSVIGAYHVANGAANLADFVRRMAADVGDFFRDLKDEHGNIFKAAQKEAERATADKFDVSPAEVLAGIDRENVTTKDVRKLIAAHVGAGLRGEQAVIAAAAKDLGLADDEVRSLFVQSIPRGAQSLTEAQQELSDLRKLVRLQNEIERLEAGRPKPEPGKPQPDSPAVAERKAELADLRKRLRPVRDPEGRYQEMRGKQIAKRIAELQARIAAGDFASRQRVPRALNDANQRAMFELDKAKEDFLRHQFEDEMRRRSPLAKAWGTVADTFNLARAVMTSFDLSAVLRQGGFLAYGHPLRAAKALGPSLKAFVREANEHKVNNEIANRKNAPLYKKYGLQLTGIGAGPLTQIEEAYASRWLSKLPWWSGAGLVRGSGRAYVAFLNKLRADSFDAMVATLSRNTTPTDAEGKAIANYINVATGRGKAVGGEMAAQALNTVFFAPRLVASRFQLLAGQPLYGGTARTRKLVAQEYARFAIGASAVIALAAFALGAGEDDDDEKPLIGLDPRSADFLKIRVGDTYIDPMAGLAQVSTFLAREATGETVTGAGKVKPLRTGYTLTDLRRALGEDIPAHKMAKDGGLPFGSGNAADVLGRFLRTKLAPVPGAIINTLAGSDVIGNTITPAQSAQQMVTPMTFQNIADIMEEHGIPKGTAIEVLGLLGMGVQQRQESNADQFSEFNDNLKAVQADVKDRLAALPQEQWPQALATMKQQYGPAMEGVELQTYKTDGKYGAAGEFKRDADGKPILVSNRIADESAYRKAANAPDGDQVHHIIPDNLVRHHPLMRRARELGYDLDSAANLLAMPAKAGGDAIAHNTDHPDYDAEVFGQLQEAEKQLKREHGTLKDVPREELLDAVRQIEDTMRAKIQSKDVPTKGGRLAVNDSAPTAISA